MGPERECPGRGFSSAGLVRLCCYEQTQSVNRVDQRLPPLESLKAVTIWLAFGGALVFGAALAVIAALYFATSVSRVALFWAAFILGGV